VISQFRNGQESFYHTDGQGSTLALTDANGDVTDTYAYSAFGEVTARTGSTVNQFQYIGQKQYYRDAETGEYDVRRRPLCALEGTWLSVDLWESEAARPRPYIYGFNCPISFVDPSGLVITRCQCEVVEHWQYNRERSWVVYTTGGCTTACCSTIVTTGPYGPLTTCTGTPLKADPQRALLMGFCKGVASCKKCKVATCEQMMIDILESYGWANSQALGTFSGFLESRGKGQYGGRCHYWSAEFNAMFDKCCPTVPDREACLNTPVHRKITLSGKYKDHSINYIKNVCTGSCLVVDDGFWGGLGQVYDPCTVKPPAMDSQGTKTWNEILATCGCPGKAMPIPVQVAPVVPAPQNGGR
jgi:RHS repeat-associated protein